MTDDNEESNGEQGRDAAEIDDESESQSFRERVEAMRDARSGEGDEGDRPESPFGGGAGMGGGNPMAQMMGGMMGGGPGGAPGGESEGAAEELVLETRKLRDEVHDVRRELERIADALEDD